MRHNNGKPSGFLLSGKHNQQVGCMIKQQAGSTSSSRRLKLEFNHWNISCFLAPLCLYTGLVLRISNSHTLAVSGISLESLGFSARVLPWDRRMSCMDERCSIWALQLKCARLWRCRAYVAWKTLKICFEGGTVPRSPSKMGFKHCYFFHESLDRS